MKAFARVLRASVQLAALGAAGCFGWVLWTRNRALDDQNAELEVERARLRNENDRLAAELRRLGEAKDALGRNLAQALSACERAKGDLASARSAKDLAEKSLREELGRVRRRADQADARLDAGAREQASLRRELQASDARAKAAQDARARAEEVVRRMADDQPGVATLRELVELTDLAVRRLQTEKAREK